MKNLAIPTVTISFNKLGEIVLLWQASQKIKDLLSLQILLKERNYIEPGFLHTIFGTILRYGF